MEKKKKSQKHTNNKFERWTEEQYEEYLKDLYGMEFIAGFTEGGVPYGTFEDDLEPDLEIDLSEEEKEYYESFN